MFLYVPCPSISIFGLTLSFFSSLVWLGDFYYLSVINGGRSHDVIFNPCFNFNYRAEMYFYGIVRIHDPLSPFSVY